MPDCALAWRTDAGAHLAPAVAVARAVAAELWD
jgi:hypothetical protein